MQRIVFWIVIRLESLILRTCEHKALSERDLCVRILEMHVEAMHGSICAVLEQNITSQCADPVHDRDGNCNACECT